MFRDNPTPGPSLLQRYRSQLRWSIAVQQDYDSKIVFRSMLAGASADAHIPVPAIGGSRQAGPSGRIFLSGREKFIAYPLRKVHLALLQPLRLAPLWSIQGSGFRI